LSGSFPANLVNSSGSANGKKNAKQEQKGYHDVLCQKEMPAQFMPHNFPPSVCLHKLTKLRATSCKKKAHRRGSSSWHSSTS